MGKSIWEKGIIAKVRFDTPKGLLSMETIQDLPLDSQGGTSLDLLARDLSKQIIATGGKSFVGGKTTGTKLLALKLDIVLATIKRRLADQESAVKASLAAKKRNLIAEIIDDKQTDELKGKSMKELKELLKNT